MKQEKQLEKIMSNKYEKIDKYENNTAVLYGSIPLPPASLSYTSYLRTNPIMPIEKPLPPLFKELPLAQGFYKPIMNLPQYRDRINDW